MTETKDTRLHLSVNINDKQAVQRIALMLTVLGESHSQDWTKQPEKIIKVVKPAAMGPTGTTSPAPLPPIETPAPPVEVPAPPVPPVTTVTPPPPTEIPAPPVTPTEATPGAVDVDNTGRPWDARIDSSNKKKTKTGVWAKRKFVTKELYAQIVAELMSGAGGAVSVAPETVPAPPVTPVTPVPPTTPGTVPAPPTAAPPAPPAAAAPPAPPAAAAPPAPRVDPMTVNSIVLFMAYIDKHGIDAATATAACKAKGVDSIALLGTGSYAPCIPSIVEYLEAQRNAV